MSLNLFWDIETTGLDYLKNRITCISVVLDNDSAVSFIDESEKKLLKRFVSWFREFIKSKKEDYPFYLWGWNSDAFDLPFVKMRCLKHRVVFDLPVTFRDVKLEFDYNPKTDEFPHFSQALSFLGLDGKSGYGLRAVYLWELRRYNPKMVDELQRYCEDDAFLVKKVFEKVRRDG